MLGHMNTLIDEVEDDYSHVGDVMEEDGGEPDGETGESGLTGGEGEANVPARPALVEAGIERESEVGLEEQEWGQWNAPSSSPRPIEHLFLCTRPGPRYNRRISP